ncbi:hypothetical protein B0H21DRAFT_813317 [Amylocystis lapponica]|nr:hypothetical protein B0H21DRAFT_813317 [Amylocystis lapponica]
MTNSPSTVNPSEVGWQFVPQYYTFVNKQPNRLHCFYTKASTFIHGTEGEDGKPCYGQQEIHNKITSIGFQDCKVFIHSVDAQSSANGGIIIQVIGEMSNHGEAWRKFVQTFFLAEQPNGYFVLNDIFRFLKEEAVESDDQASDAEGAAPVSQSQKQPTVPILEYIPAPSTPSTPAPPPPAEPEPEHAPTPTPAPLPAAVEEAPVPVAPSPAPAPEPQLHPNGHAPEPKLDVAIAPEKSASPSPAPELPATASPLPVSPLVVSQPLAVSPAPPAPAPQPPAPTYAPAAPVPSAPSGPRSWANLAATDSKKWGSAVAQEVRGVSEAPVATASPVQGGLQSPAPHAPRPAQREAHPAYVAATNVPTAQCFVKSVTENVSDAALKQVLVSRFGPIKELEILRPKACAFLEFVHIDAARRAIAASLPPAQGGEGGIRIEGEGGSAPRIHVETRKDRSERPPPRGPPVNGARGGYRGRGGPGGRGRGGGVPPK